MGLFETLKRFFLQMWDVLKKIRTQIVNFFNHIANWFRAKYREIINQHPNASAIALIIDEKLSSGYYGMMDIGLKRGVVNTFYDRSTGEILSDHTEIVEYEDLDAETKSRFGNKDMLILQ